MGAPGPRAGVAEPIVTQPRYNLVDRAIERGVKPAAEELGLTVVPYSALASGFLTGKYCSTDASGQSSPRAGSAEAYATPDGLAVLSALDEVAALDAASAPFVG